VTDHTTTHDQPTAQQPAWLSFAHIHAEVAKLFTPPPRRRAIQRALRRAGVPARRPTAASDTGSPATIYYERHAAERWLEEAQKPQTK